MSSCSFRLGWRFAMAGTLIASLSGTCDSAHAQERADAAPFVAHATPDEQASRLAALRAAYDALDAAHVATQGKVITITPVDGLIVVSFLPLRRNTRDGEAHVTYDPRKARVVKVVADG